MKKRTLVAMLLMAITVGLLTTCEDNAAIPTATIESTSDSLSYAWGVQLAEALKQRANNLDPDVVAKAVKEAWKKMPKWTWTNVVRWLLLFPIESVRKQ